MRECRIVELRASCNEVPRTPPGPEGSNGTGLAECAAETPKFLDLNESNQLSVIGDQSEASSEQIATIRKRLVGDFSALISL